MPGSVPGPGQQYAFEVDLDRCSGCKACVAACHALNGLDNGETWRDVGLIIGGPTSLPVLQHITSACHHCLDPACLNVCPVDAYGKDAVTGVVKHLDDQCFGCQYCTLAWPYDAPKFHSGKGIVRKCDMCSGRLELGEAPACVQGCPHEAIRICVVSHAEVVASADANAFLPSAPRPDYKLPTTRYVTEKPLQGPMRAADHYRNEAEHVHWPLVFMLVLTQGSTGGFFADFAARHVGLDVHPALPRFSLVLGLAGIAASLLHLGRPLYAYRALIGLRHSWLSREVAAFALFAQLALAKVVVVGLKPSLTMALDLAVAAAGVMAVFCSVMVYHVVRRPFWHASFCGTKFADSVVVLGLAALMVSAESPALCFGLMAVAGAKTMLEIAVLHHLRDPRLTPLRCTPLLLCGPLVQVSLVRLSLGLLGGLVLPLTVAIGLPPVARTAVAGLAFLSLLGGELAERYLFFAAVVRHRMPGAVSS